METAIVSFKEITEKKKNPSGCISALRYTNSCVKCAHFQQAYTRYKRDDHGKLRTIRLTTEEVIDRLNCKPIVTPIQKQILKKRDTLWEKKQELRKMIEYIDTHITGATDQFKRDTAEEINKMLDDIIEDLKC